jgi:ribonuclease BN (tRNA processing enzyme)
MDFINSWQKILPFDEYQLVGYSRGSFKTGLMIAPLRIFLDAGVCSQYEPNMILITHGHSDHVGELYNILIGNSRKIKVPIFTAPNLTKLIGYHLNSHISLNRGFPDKYNRCDIIGLNSKHRITIQGKLIELEPFEMDHQVDTIGFGISEIREKLKPEYMNKEQSEIIEIKKTTKITEEKTVPLFLFCGDTGHSVLDKLPFNKYPTVIIESTFFEPEHVQEARDRKHLHIYDLEKYFVENSKTLFILIHFSNRYVLDELKTFQKIYEHKYDNIKFFI